MLDTASDRLPGVDNCKSWTFLNLTLWRKIRTRLRRRVGVDEDERTPLGDGHRFESEVFRPEVLDVLEAVGAGEAPVQAVRPAVVGAGEPVAKVVERNFGAVSK